MPSDDEAAQIARGLTKAQQASDEAITKACCGDAACWSRNDIDGWMPPGCAKCWAMLPRVRAALEALEKNDGQ
jgi:hypothetical protein